MARSFHQGNPQFYSQVPQNSGHMIPSMHPNRIQPIQSVPMSSQITGSSSGGLANSKVLKRAWHSLEHKEARDLMVEKIVALLKRSRPNANEDWHDKLPSMAKRLEDALYGQAQDFQEYNESSTLKSRLQQLALSIGGKPKSGGQ